MGWFTGKSKAEKEEEKESVNFPEHKRVYSYNTKGEKITAEDAEEKSKAITCVGTFTFGQSREEIVVLTGNDFSIYSSETPTREYKAYVLEVLYDVEVEIEGVNKKFKIKDKVAIGTFEKEHSFYETIGSILEEGMNESMENRLKSDITENLVDKIRMEKAQKAKDFMDSFESLKINLVFDVKEYHRDFDTINGYKE